MNLIANTILARRRLIGSIRSRTHGSNQLKPPKSLKNHLQSKGRPHTVLVTLIVTQNLVSIVVCQFNRVKGRSATLHFCP
jgi:hypothetical protein